MLIQRVANARVEVEGQTVGSIGVGALVLFGVRKNDQEEQIVWLANKLLHLRMFMDEEQKVNNSGPNVCIKSPWNMSFLT